MSNLSDEYQKIMNNLEKQITDQEQLELVKNSIANLTVTFMDTVDKVLEYSDEKLNNLEEKQQDLEERLSRVQKIVDNIEKYIYEDENDFEFEVVCPYCNHQFVTDIDVEESSEIKCPECKNIIELDFNDDESECGGHCSSCSGCGSFEKDKKENNSEDDEDM